MKKSECPIWKKSVAAGACAVLLLVMLLVTFAPKLGLGFSWEDVFAAAGLRSDVLDETSQSVEVSFIDVGQGDCAFIRAPGGNILIDVGESGSDEAVNRYLRNLSVTSIDYVIATHPHSDHIGAMEKVMSEYNISNVIMPRLSEENTPTTKTYEKFLAAVAESGARVIAASAGASYSLGELSLEILGPLRQSDELNNMSVVVRVVYGDTAILFMGDAEKDEENDIIASGAYLDCDVLKVAHHGSSTSTTKKFLKLAMPEYAVISCGEDNSYEHPNLKIVERLEKSGATVLRTDLSGTIVIYTDGKTVTVGENE